MSIDGHYLAEKGQWRQYFHNIAWACLFLALFPESVGMLLRHMLRASRVGMVTTHYTYLELLETESWPQFAVIATQFVAYIASLFLVVFSFGAFMERHPFKRHHNIDPVSDKTYRHMVMSIVILAFIRGCCMIWARYNATLSPGYAIEESSYDHNIWLIGVGIITQLVAASVISHIATWFPSTLGYISTLAKAGLLTLGDGAESIVMSALPESKASYSGAKASSDARVTATTDTLPVAIPAMPASNNGPAMQMVRLSLSTAKKSG